MCLLIFWWQSFNILPQQSHHQLYLHIMLCIEETTHTIGLSVLVWWKPFIISPIEGYSNFHDIVCCFWGRIPDIMGEENGEGRSLAETPTYAVATVITVLVSLSFLFQGTLKKLVKVRKYMYILCFSLAPSNFSHL